MVAYSYKTNKQEKRKEYINMRCTRNNSIYYIDNNHGMYTIHGRIGTMQYLFYTEEEAIRRYIRDCNIKEKAGELA